jgi:hypothetical protein
MLAQGFGPGAVAVAILYVADETQLAGGGDFFFQCTEIGAERVVVGDTEATIFEIAAEGEGEFLFFRRGETDGFDFPAETFAGALGEMLAHAGVVDAGAFELRKREDGEELIFDFGEGLIVEFEADQIGHYRILLLANIDYAEIARPGDVDAKIERV